MKALWTGVSASALLAFGAAAAFAAAPPVPMSASAPAASHNATPARETAGTVTIELADATRAPSASLYISFANPMSGRAFAGHNDQGSITGHLIVAPPPAFSLAGADRVSLADVTVVRNVAPSAALEFSDGDTGLADPYALRASLSNDGLFLSDSALSSPYASLTNGGAYGGVRVSLGHDLNLRFGAASRSGLALDTGLALSQVPRELLASTANGFNAQSASAGVEWRFADWAGIAVTASRTNERGAVLGRAMAGPIAVSNGAGTAAFGVSARVGFGDGWVTTLAFDRGATHLDLKPGTLMPNAGAPPESFDTESYGVAVTKEDIFGNDMLGFSLSRPVQSNATVFGDSSFGPRARLPLSALAGANTAQESDVQLGYVTTFLDGSLALQANAGYQVNANGENGQNAVTGVARAKITF